MWFIFKGLLYLAGGGVTLTAGFASYLAFLQPPLYFPQPTGEHVVGTVTYHLVDETRKAFTGSDTDHPHKELMVQVWYPAQGKVSSVALAPHDPVLKGYLKQNSKLGWLLTMSRPAYSYAVKDAPLFGENGEHLPVIIFSHGMGCTRNMNTAHCEELASKGYVVVGISHSFGGSIVKFPDGRVVAMNAIEQQRQQQQMLVSPMDFFRESNDKIGIWIDDVQMVLDELEKLTVDQTSPFYGRLDMNNIGMIGHSYGGAATVQLCRRDNRIKAGVDMDGPLFGDDATQGFDKPMMFLLAPPMSEVYMEEQMKNAGMAPAGIQEYSRATCESFHPAIDSLIDGMGHDAYKITLQNSGHMAFCDMAIMKEGNPLSGCLQNFGAGSINGYRATKIVNAHLIAFFDKYLKRKPSELLDGNGTEFPECTIERC